MRLTACAKSTRSDRESLSDQTRDLERVKRRNLLVHRILRHSRRTRRHSAIKADVENASLGVFNVHLARVGLSSYFSSDWPPMALTRARGGTICNGATSETRGILCGPWVGNDGPHCQSQPSQTEFEMGQFPEDQ